MIIKLTNNLESINESATTESDIKNLSKSASKIANELEDFLAQTTKIENLSDYLDEYDIENLQGALDALRFIKYSV